MAIQLIKNKFFAIFCDKYPHKEAVILIAPEGKSHMDLPDEGYIENWEPIIFTKMKEDEILTDYPATNICDRICSPKLREIIEDNLTEEDNEIQWLPMHIKDEETGDITEYYYLHFPEYCDILNLEKSTINPVLGNYDKKIICYQKVKDRSVFNCPKAKFFIDVSKKLKEEIFKQGCTGISVDQETVIDEISEDKKVS